jgi:transcriptional regulator NrdR family protein
MVGESDGRKHDLKPFSRDHLFLSVYNSCKHRANAVSEASSLTQTIINKLVSERPDGIIDSKEIAKQTYLVLKHFDQAAATVYAAYHSVIEP